MGMPAEAKARKNGKIKTDLATEYTPEQPRQSNKIPSQKKRNKETKKEKKEKLLSTAREARKKNKQTARHRIRKIETQNNRCYERGFLVGNMAIQK